jgi:hypothetical protein
MENSRLPKGGIEVIVVYLRTGTDLNVTATRFNNNNNYY